MEALLQIYRNYSSNFSGVYTALNDRFPQHSPQTVSGDLMNLALGETLAFIEVRSGRVQVQIFKEKRTWRTPRHFLVLTPVVWTVESSFIAEVHWQKWIVISVNEFTRNLVDFKNITFRASYYECAPLFFTRNEEFMGLEHDILRAISKALNFQLKFVLLNSSNLWGEEVNGTWVGGVIGAVVQSDAHIGLFAPWLKYERLKYIDFSVPYGRMSVGFLVPEIRTEENWKSIYSPFSPALWVLVLVTVVVSALALTLLSRLSGYGTGLTEWTLAVVGHMSGCKSLPDTTSRVGAYLVSLAALVLGTLYSSSVVSHLTSPPVAPVPTTIRDLVLGQYLWTREDVDPDFKKLLNLHDEWQRQLVGLYRLPEEKIDQKAVAQLVKLMEGMSLGEPIVAQLSGLPLRPLPELVSNHPVGLAFPKGSLLYPHFNLALLRLIDSGVVKKMTSDLAFIIKEGYEKAGKEGPKENRPLSLATMQGAFFLLVGGQICATLIFLIELLMERQKLKAKKAVKKIIIIY